MLDYEERRIMNNHISIKDIAREVGVSASTVSRVLSNKSNISIKTREKVMAVVEKHNFSLNPAAQALKRTQSSTVGIIVPDILNEHFAEITLYIELELMKLGYLCVICNSYADEDISRKRAQILSTLNVSGIVCIYSDIDFTKVRPDIPAIFVGSIPSSVTPQDNYVYVQFDDINGGKIATEKLIMSGCKRIMLVMSQRYNAMKSNEQRGRFIGYQQALWEHGFETDTDLLLQLNESTADCANQMLIQKLKDGVKFDGIFINTGKTAIGILHALNCYNLKVPEDVKLIVYENCGLAKFNAVGITAIEQSAKDAGAIVAEHMIKLINGEILENRIVRIPIEIIQRETT